MYTKKGYIISISIVLMVSIAIGFCGLDSSMKAQLQNALGKEDPPCYDVCEKECGGPLDECDYCINQGRFPPAGNCQSEGIVWTDDTYNVCYGTSATKYCSYYRNAQCGYRFYCQDTGYEINMVCGGSDCVSDPAEVYCRECERNNPVPGGAIEYDDEVCQ